MIGRIILLSQGVRFTLVGIRGWVNFFSQAHKLTASLTEQKKSTAMELNHRPRALQTLALPSELAVQLLGFV